MTQGLGWWTQVWLKPGDELGDSLFTAWKNVVLPPVAGLDFSVVFSKGFRGTTLLDKSLVESYDQFLTSLAAYPRGGVRHYLWADFMQSGIKGSALLERILNEPNGSSSILQVQCHACPAAVAANCSPMLFLCFPLFRKLTGIDSLT
jgi:hypothetical protein